VAANGHQGLAGIPLKSRSQTATPGARGDRGSGSAGSHGRRGPPRRAARLDRRVMSSTARAGTSRRFRLRRSGRAPTRRRSTPPVDSCAGFNSQTRMPLRCSGSGAADVLAGRGTGSRRRSNTLSGTAVNRSGPCDDRRGCLDRRGPDRLPGLRAGGVRGLVTPAAGSSIQRRKGPRR
jgi:hypothetical protein